MAALETCLAIFDHYHIVYFKNLMPVRTSDPKFRWPRQNFTYFDNDM